MENEISDLISEFATKYPAEIKQPFRLTDNSKILTDKLPKLVSKKLGLIKSLKTKGSVGVGNWGEIPWMAIMDTEITTSTERGYYIAYLFDKKLQNIYLSLAVGWTQYKSEYGTKDGRIKIEATCKHYAKYLSEVPGDFSYGTINLNAENTLGKGYEMGIIISKRYSIEELTDEEILEDTKNLIAIYEELKFIVGDSILNLEVDPNEYSDEVKTFRKKIAKESISNDVSKSIVKLINIAKEEPPEVRKRLMSQIVRNRKFAQYVKEKANFVCEIDGRKPFIQKNGKPYAEADHIIPLGGDARGLDRPDNMRCVCPQCHSVLTHGSEKEMKKLFRYNE